MTTSLDSPSSLNLTATYPDVSSPTADSGRLSLAGNTVCLGHGLDASVDGLLVTIALSGLTGLFLWVRCTSPMSFATSYACQLSFALVRPYCRQIYGLREWFVQERCVCSTSPSAFPLTLQRLRPAPLRPTLWAFFNPPVPVAPSISNVPSDPADPAAADPRRFPSDEELSQRTLWSCFLIVLGWSILGLAGALPLYIISIPCLAKTAPTPHFVGGYSTLLDLSILRVLMLLDNRDVSTSSETNVLEVVNGQDLKSRARVRIIVLTALLIVLGIVPALVKILREYGNLVAFRRKWTDVHLQGKEMGWLSAREAPGFVSWGEKRLKDFILKTGLSSSLDFSAAPASSGTGRGGRSGRRGLGSPYMVSEENVGQEVDVLSLFTIVYVSRPDLL
jgi:calcium permeable stress-gated cation channel